MMMSGEKYNKISCRKSKFANKIQNVVLENMEDIEMPKLKTSITNESVNRMVSNTSIFSGTAQICSSLAFY